MPDRTVREQSPCKAVPKESWGSTWVAEQRQHPPPHRGDTYYLKTSAEGHESVRRSGGVHRKRLIKGMLIWLYAY